MKKRNVLYLNVYDICHYPFGRSIADNGKSSGEYMRGVLISALQSESDVVCLDFTHSILPSATWLHEVFSKLTNIQKSLAVRKLYIRDRNISFIVFMIEKYLDGSMYKHYEIKKEAEVLHKKYLKSKTLFGRIMKYFKR